MDDKRKLMLFVERIMNLSDGELKDKFREYQEQLDDEQHAISAVLTCEEEKLKYKVRHVPLKYLTERGEKW